MSALIRTILLGLSLHFLFAGPVSAVETTESGAVATSCSDQECFEAACEGPLMNLLDRE